MSDAFYHRLCLVNSLNFFEMGTRDSADSIYVGIVGTRDKRIHGALRRPVANMFSMSSISNQESFIDDTINLFMKRLDEEFIRPRKACNIDKWLQYC